MELQGAFGILDSEGLTSAMPTGMGINLTESFLILSENTERNTDLDCLFCYNDDFNRSEPDRPLL